MNNMQNNSETSENQGESVNPRDVVLNLISDFKDRTKDIISKRFGLNEGKKQTLEEIGRNHGITRERVRQIESATIKDIKKSEKIKDLERCEDMLEEILKENGNVMGHAELIKAFSKKIGIDGIHENIIEFMLDISERFDDHSESDRTHKAWSIKGVDLEVPKKIVDTLKENLKGKSKPVSEKEAIGYIMKHDISTEHDVEDEKYIKSYLSISKEVLKNPYSEWGLNGWNEIMPKGVKDKAYLVLKKNEKPLHFTEISNKINEVKFNGKRAIPQTVHNELIKDKRFVLVGRGIYGLVEWGYTPGTVADVIEKVMQDNGGTMQKDEIVEKVLDQRLVKKNTIILALQDKSRFLKDGQKTYSLAG